MGKKLNSRQRCASDVTGDVAGDKSLATGVHFRFGPCTLHKSVSILVSYIPYLFQFFPGRTFPETFKFVLISKSIKTLEK